MWPAWRQPDTTTRPLPATSTITFWSSRISGSGSQPPPARARWMGEPSSKPLTLGPPPAAGPREVEGEAELELADPRNLARDQHPAVEQQGGAALFHHLQALGLQVGPARRGEVELGPGREGDLAVPPGPRMDQQGQPAAPVAGG